MPRSTPVLLGGLLLLGPWLAACVASPPAAGPALTATAERPYRLPFEPGVTRLLVQGGPGPFSHTGTQAFALDFAMPEGSAVLAARGGRVVAVKEDSDTGGASRTYAEKGNFVRVRHDDGTHGVYLHLQKDGALVSVGDVVRQGQVIARSGDTGWSAMPHLHFQVDRKEEETGRWSSIPVAFADVKGDGVPQMLLWYRSGNRISE